MMSRVTPLRPLLHEMRLIKSPAEIALMRRSAQVSKCGSEKGIEIWHFILSPYCCLRFNPTCTSPPIL